MIPNQYPCQVKDHALVFNESLPLKDGEYILTIKKPGKQRTSQQNRYLWGVVYNIIATETGSSVEEIHYSMKIMFLRDRLTIHTTHGATVQIPCLRSLSDNGDVDTAEMTTYIEQVRAFAATELGLNIPDPGETE